jgi:hypothetical protein
MASFEPSIMLMLSPLYLTETGQIQLLTGAIGVALAASVLHFIPNKKTLAVSFIPTICMISGIGMGLYNDGFNITSTNTPMWLIFFVLLIMTQVDYTCILNFPKHMERTRYHRCSKCRYGWYVKYAGIGEPGKEPARLQRRRITLPGGFGGGFGGADGLGRPVPHAVVSADGGKPLRNDLDKLRTTRRQ